MATAAIGEALEDLQCPICFEEFTKPKVLTCKHVFCCKCLVKWKKEKDTFKCPLCNADHRLREGERVEDLPEPLLISKLLETFSRFMTSSITDTIDRICDVCAGSKRASFICRSCLKNMCETCEKTHSSKAIFQSHIVIKLSKRTLCQSHKGQLKTLYCTRCQSAICELCYDTTHEGHDIVEMQTVLPGKRQKLADFRQSAQTIRATLRETDTKSFIKQIESDYSQYLHQLDGETDLLSKKLQDTELLKQKVQMQKQGAKKKLSLYHGEIQDAIATNESLELYIDDILSKGHEADVVSCADELPDVNERYDIERPNFEVPVAKVSSLNPVLGATASLGSDIMPSTATVISSRIAVEIWRREIGHDAVDIEYDAADCALWVRTEDADGYIWKYDLKGNVLKKLWKSRGLISICMDTKRDILVLGSMPNTITTISKRDGVTVSRFIVKDVELLYDVAFDKTQDNYIITDGGKTCVWIIAANSGKVLGRISAEKGFPGRTQKRIPSLLQPVEVSVSIALGPIPHPCVLVSDRPLGGVHVLTADGSYVNTYGVRGSGQGQLVDPRSSCLDTIGRIVVCDWGNRRVVRFGTAPHQEHFEVVVSTEQLEGMHPQGACMVKHNFLAITAQTPDRKSDYTLLFSYE